MVKNPPAKTGGLCLIPWSGSSPGEGNGKPFRYSWASLVAQLVKNPPAMRETWVQSLGQEDPLEEGMATHASILGWRIPMDRGTWRATVHGVAKESDTTERLKNKPQRSKISKPPLLHPLPVGSRRLFCLWVCVSWMCCFRSYFRFHT